MKEIRDLDIILSDEGWDKFGGKSYNVWGNVKFPEELLYYINKNANKPAYYFDFLTGKKMKNIIKRISVWTAFDDYIYEKYGKTLSADELPRISATFKSCFTKYGAVAENIGMKIAMALDLPTSYNYIVKFNPEDYPEIVKNYPNYNAKNELQPCGIVSIDFLQNKKAPTKVSTSEYDEEEIEAISEIEGDRLITFDDALQRCGFRLNTLEGKQNLIENWIKVVDALARKELSEEPLETINKMINNIHSRIARSFLLKDCVLGDCDFTANNGGIVINDVTKKIRYAPNHDYGESFNNLIQDKLDHKPMFGMTEEDINALPPAIRDRLWETIKNKKEKTIAELAKTPASSTSVENFYYVLKNFPRSSKEFFESLDQLVQKGNIDKILDEYSTLSCNGKPLLTKEEIEIFKEYIMERCAYYCELYVNYLQENQEEIPQIAYSEHLFDEDYIIQE